MKKLITACIITCLVLFGIFTFTGCFLFGEEMPSIDYDEQTYIDISSAEELLAMQPDKSYKLTCDIDLGGMTWDPICVVGFNGDGHTISNFVLNSINQDYVAFFSWCYYLENLTFDNAVLIATNTGFVSFGVAGRGDFSVFGTDYFCKNVTVKNSKLTVNNNDVNTYIGVISTNDSNTMIDCHVENCTVDCNISSTTHVQIGGIINSAKSIENCSATNLTINGDCSNSGGTLYAGGIVCYDTEVKNSYVKDSTISIQHFGENFVGGLIGRSYNKIVGCGVENCDISFKGNTSYSDYSAVGGFAGQISENVLSAESSISQCYVNNCTVSGTSNDYNAYAGGFVGINDESISSSFVANTTISTSGCKTSGFSAKPDNGITYCGVYNLTLNSDEDDIFAAESNLIYKCYADNYTHGKNSNDVEVLSESVWKSSSLSDYLHLSTSLWTFKDNNLPKLNIITGE